MPTDWYVHRPKFPCTNPYPSLTLTNPKPNNDQPGAHQYVDTSVNGHIRLGTGAHWSVGTWAEYMGTLVRGHTGWVHERIGLWVHGLSTQAHWSIGTWAEYTDTLVRGYMGRVHRQLVHRHMGWVHKHIGPGVHGLSTQAHWSVGTWAEYMGTFTHRHMGWVHGHISPWAHGLSTWTHWSVGTSVFGQIGLNPLVPPQTWQCTDKKTIWKF